MMRHLACMEEMIIENQLNPVDQLKELCVDSNKP